MTSKCNVRSLARFWIHKFWKKIKPMKDIIGTIGNFEYGEYINRSQCYVNVRCLEYDYVLVMNTS